MGTYGRRVVEGELSAQRGLGLVLKRPPPHNSSEFFRKSSEHKLYHTLVHSGTMNKWLL